MASSAAEFLALPGSPAYSPFRLAELKESLNASLGGAGPKVTDVNSIHVYYVSGKNKEAVAQLKKPDSEERAILDKLVVYAIKSTELGYDTETETLVKALGGEEAKDGKKRLLLYVVPRKGTISPWSSKATSITAVCGLGEVVQRIERGVLISLVFDGEYKDSEGPYPFADALHDRMTQVGALLRSTNWPHINKLFADSRAISPKLRYLVRHSCPTSCRPGRPPFFLCYSPRVSRSCQQGAWTCSRRFRDRLSPGCLLEDRRLSSQSLRCRAFYVCPS